MLELVLLIAAAICLGLAVFNVGGFINPLALGLLCWLLTVLIPHL